MGFLGPLAALLGLELESVTARLKASAIAYAFIALFATVGVVFLLVAAYLLLAENFGPVVAAFIIAGVFLVLALVVYLSLVMSHSRHKRELAQRRRASETGTFVSAAALTAIPLIAKSPWIVKLGLPAAAIAAFALLKKPDRD